MGCYPGSKPETRRLWWLMQQGSNSMGLQMFYLLNSNTVGNIASYSEKMPTFGVP